MLHLFPHPPFHLHTHSHTFSPCCCKVNVAYQIASQLLNIFLDGEEIQTTEEVRIDGRREKWRLQQFSSQPFAMTIWQRWKKFVSIVALKLGRGVRSIGVVGSIRIMAFCFQTVRSLYARANISTNNRWSITMRYHWELKRMLGLFRKAVLTALN